jgi:anti-sigma-K factor RskA
MSDTDRSGDDLFLARLYAAGELDESAAAAFECRLADDQAARDALCAAVRDREVTADPCGPVPDPRYRERVRQRLHKPAWRRVVGRVGYREHPSLWAVAGAATAALVLLSIRSGLRPADEPATPPPAAEWVAKEVPPACEEVADGLDEWPDLISGHHLARAVHEENRRKVRAEDRRMVRMEDRAARLRGAQDYRQ